MDVINYIQQFHAEQIDVNKIEGSKKFINLLMKAEKYPLKRYLAFLFLKHKMNLKTQLYKYTKYQIHIDDTNLIYGAMLSDDESTMPLYVILSDNEKIFSYSDFLDDYEKNNDIFNKLETILIAGITERKIAISIDDSISLKLLVFCIHNMIINNRVHGIIEKVIDVSKVSQKQIQGNDIFFKARVMPMLVGETFKVNDISFDVWRGLHLIYATTDMVLNAISPNFLIGVNWGYVEDNNESTQETMNVLNSLKRLYLETECLENKDDSRKKIMKSIKYIQTHKLMSKVSLLTVTEASRRVNKDSIFYRNMISKIDFFDAFLFSLLYGLHVLHTRVGAIHMNLTHNNILFNLIEPNLYKTAVGQIASTAYVINGESETYFLPYDAIHAVITNFEHAIMITLLNETVIDKIMDKLGGIKIRREKIANNYDTMFRALTALDYIQAMQVLRSNTALTSNTEIAARIDTVEKLAVAELQKQLDSETPQVIGDIILRKIFDNYLFDPNKSYIVEEVYNFNAVKRYSSSIISEYPEWVKNNNSIRVFESSAILGGSSSEIHSRFTLDFLNDSVDISGGSYVIN